MIYVDFPCLNSISLSAISETEKYKKVIAVKVNIGKTRLFTLAERTGSLMSNHKSANSGVTSKGTKRCWGS